MTGERWGPAYQYELAHGYGFDNAGSQKAAGHPVQTVNWFDAVKWCNARSQLESRTPCYYTDAGLTSIYKTNQVAPYVNWSANGYRLPTEAEWEKAARGGLSGKLFPWGDTITTNQANYYGSEYTSFYNLSGPFGYHPAYVTGAQPYTSPASLFAINRTAALSSRSKRHPRIFANATSPAPPTAQQTGSTTVFHPSFHDANAEKVLSGVQIVSGAVVGGAALASATGLLAPGGVPVAAVAATVNTVASGGKTVIYGAKLALKPAIAAQFQNAIGLAYPLDNSYVAAAYGDFVTFVRDEGASPFYLNTSNLFDATAEIALPSTTLWAFLGFPGLDAGENMATVTLRDRSTVRIGGGNLTARCIGYCAWVPLTSVFSGQARLVQTSSDVRGPATLPVGGQVQFQVPYRGHSKNVLSVFSPHVLVVETYVGPWRVGSASKPFVVLAPGEIFFAQSC